MRAETESVSVEDQIDKFQLLIATGGFLIDFCTFWPLVFCACSFSIYYGMHPNQPDRLEGGFRQIPTLSETGRPEPGSLFFTYGLHSQAILMAIFFTLAYVHFRNKIIKQKAKEAAEEVGDNDCVTISSIESTMTVLDGLKYCFCCSCKPQKSRERDIKFLHFWNKVLYILGLAASFLMSLVGTVTTGVDGTIHTIFASTMFVAGILHMVLYYYTIMETIGYTTFQITLHRLCMFVCIPFNFFMLIMILIMYEHCPEHDYVCMEAALDLLITLEYTTAIALLAYVYSFRSTLQHINLFTMSSSPCVSPRVSEQCQTEVQDPAAVEEGVMAVNATAEACVVDTRTVASVPAADAGSAEEGGGVGSSGGDVV